MEYMHQATPDAEPQRFSDKPKTVRGVKYKPRWNWSDDYRKEFLAGQHNYGSAVARDNDRARKYRDWLIEQTRS